MKENYFYEGNIPSFSIYIMKKMFYNKEKESEDFHGNFNLYFCMYWFDIFVFGDTSNFVATGNHHIACGRNFPFIYQA